jgi:hypothetical protein
MNSLNSRFSNPLTYIYKNYYDPMHGLLKSSMSEGRKEERKSMAARLGYGFEREKNLQTKQVKTSYTFVMIMIIVTSSESLFGALHIRNKFCSLVQRR